MKKLSGLLILLFCAVFSFSQSLPTVSAFPNNQTISNALTLYHAKGAVTGDSGIVIISFPDTTTANYSPYLKGTNGLTIKVHDTLFIRDVPKSKWLKIISGSTTVINFPGVDTVTYVNDTICFVINSLPICYTLGRYYDSVSLNHDSTYMKFWNKGNFMDSIWLPHDNVYAVPPLFINRYPSSFNIGDSVVFTIDTTGFGGGGAASGLQNNFNANNYLNREDTLLTGSNFNIQNIPNENFNKFSVKGFWENEIVTAIDSNYGWHDQGTAFVQPLTQGFGSFGDTSSSDMSIRTAPFSGNKYAHLQVIKRLTGNKGNEFKVEDGSFSFNSIINTSGSTTAPINSKIYMKVDTSGDSPTLLYGIGTDGSVQLFSGSGGSSTLQNAFDASETAGDNPTINIGVNSFTIQEATGNNVLQLNIGGQSKIQAFNPADDGYISGLEMVADPEATRWKAKASFNGGIKFTQIEAYADGSDALLTYDADVHIFNGIIQYNADTIVSPLYNVVTIDENNQLRRAAIFQQMTKAQRDALPSPLTGQVVFVTDSGGYLSWYNSGWFKINTTAD